MINNTINGRTPEEIKQAAVCCIKLGTMPDFVVCKRCPNLGVVGCKRHVINDLLAYIQQLESERDQMKRERDAAVERCVNADDVSAGYYHEIQQLESAQPKWISVEERLPEESVTVLVYRDGCCGVARLLDVEPITMWTYAGFGGDPTHWMLLPEPPEEET